LTKCSGFGRVYYGRAPDKTKVAIKKVSHKTPKEIRMNLDEISILHFCNHQNVIKYFKSYCFEQEMAIGNMG
jgi:hypothetical protein